MTEQVVILVELGLLLLALSAVATIAWRIGLSNAPLFLLAGLVLAAVDLGDFGAIEFLDVAAEVGILLLLLTLGLEFSAGEFRQSMQRHASSGVVDLILNAPPGFIAGLLLGLDWRASLALAGVTWISSSGIVAKWLSDLGRLANRETPGVLSLLVLEDIAMAAYLPLIGVLLIGGSLWLGILSAVVAVSITLAIIWAAARVEGLADRLLNHEDDEQVLLRVLGLTLAVAGLAQWAGVSAAVGAFLVGLAIPNETAIRARAVLRPLRDLFAAVFFFVFGLNTDVGLMGPFIVGAAILALVTAITKMLTAWYSGSKEGIGVKGRIRAGTALVARGEFSIVIAGLAVSAGYPEVGVFASAYVLIVAVLGPFLARSADWIATPFVRSDPAPARA